MYFDVEMELSLASPRARQVASSEVTMTTTTAAAAVRFKFAVVVIMQGGSPCETVRWLLATYSLEIFSVHFHNQPQDVKMSAEPTLHKNLLSQPVEDGHSSAPMSPPLVRSTPPELEDIFTSIGKRIYAQMNILIMCANTIAAVFSISSAVSLIEEDDDFTLRRYQFCTYGDATSVTVQCPYESSPVFLVFLILWSIYFITLFTFKFHGTVDFWSNDLRFYLANDLLNNSVFMFVAVVIGMILTAISSIGAISFVIHNGTTQSLSSIFVFTGVNMYNLYNLLGSEVQALKGMSIDDFPRSIMVNLSVSREVSHKYVQRVNLTAEPAMIARRPVDGVTAKYRDVLEFVVECVVHSKLPGGDPTLLQRLGDPEQLEDVVRKIAFFSPQK